MADDGSVMISVRVPREVRDRIDAKAKRSKVSRSIWMREILTQAADGSAPHSARALALQPHALRTDEPGGCIHPPTAYNRLPYMTVCGLCGTRVR